MKISCIIPAHNEEKSIASTLRAVLQVTELFEIIVVDDCSTDTTKSIVETFSNVRLLINKKNEGKSRSIARGIEASTGDHLFFLDADLLGLSPEAVTSLITPIQNKQADVVISFRGNTPRWLKKLVNLEIISGDRIVPAPLMIKHLDEIRALENFGLEVFLNKIIIQNKLRIQSVLIENVYNDWKIQKRGLWGGVKGEVLMWRDIFKVVSPIGYVYQNIRMYQLLVEKK